MTSAVIVRYQVKPEAVEANEVLVRNVYAELADTDPVDFKYTTYRLDDGVTFLHVALLTGGTNPLQSSPAFAAFQAELGERCAEPPAPMRGEVVGSYPPATQ